MKCNRSGIPLRVILITIFFGFLFVYCFYSGDHVEVISVDFDPNEISFLEILNLFWNNHEYGLGTKVKRQYQSYIFCHDDKQKRIATESLEYEIVNRPTTPITTQIVPVGTIYTAEEWVSNSIYLNKLHFPFVLDARNPHTIIVSIANEFVYFFFNSFSVIIKNTICKATKIWPKHWAWMKSCWNHHMLRHVWMDI